MHLSSTAALFGKASIVASSGPAVAPRPVPGFTFPCWVAIPEPAVEGALKRVVPTTVVVPAFAFGAVVPRNVDKLGELALVDNFKDAYNSNKY